MHSMDTLYKETTLFSVSVTSLFLSSRSTAMNQVKSFRLTLQVCVHYFHNNSRIESIPCRVSDQICLTYTLLFHTFWFYILHRSLNTNRCYGLNSHPALMVPILNPRLCATSLRPRLRPTTRSIRISAAPQPKLWAYSYG